MSANIYFMVLFLFLGLGCSAQSAISGDFDEVRQASGSDFEFVFHNEHNLLVVLQENKCYYYGLTDEAEYHLLNEDERHRVEGELADMILHPEQNGYSYIRQTSFIAMRNTYKDVLADFYCIDKDVFVIDIPSEDAQRLFKPTTTQPTITTTIPTTTTTTTTRAAASTDLLDFLLGHTTAEHPFGGLNESEENFLDSILGR